jgi:glycosyltransferase involved in cell wall biosynthesis
MRTDLAETTTASARTEGRPRIAWLGPAPRDVGGVPAMAEQMLLGLADSGADLELFIDSERTDVLEALNERENVRVSAFSSRWRYNRWYSSSALTSLASGTAARVHVGSRLAERVVERHAVRPFDVVYRLSQIELLALRPFRARLPPIVLHPEVHAYGEFRHHWRERSLALRSEPAHYFAVNHAYLGYRSLLQRRDLRDVALLIAPSDRFAAHIATDYGYPRERIRVIPNVVDIERFTPAATMPPPTPVRLIFASRLSVRKGVDQIVELSHRLGDLRGRVRIDCLGSPSLFSNYSALVKDLNPAIARHLGHVAPSELPDLYRSAHGLVQPSLYEPYAITVGEALATGLPVIVSDEVGAGEGVDPRVCRIHAAGDVPGLEREVRRLVDEVERGWNPALRDVAREHAETYLSRDHFARELLGAVSAVPSHAPA